MMAVQALLLLVLALFAVGIAAILLHGRDVARALVYGASLLLCALIGLIGLWALIVGAEQSLRLPLGLPWIGVHFRLDALAAFFLMVLGLGGAMASLFGIGYGRHEASPGRVLPFFPAFAGAMALVVLAADAFSFLVAWESMSLLSWALVMTNHQLAETRKAGFVYLTMALFGTFSMILAFGVLAGAQGDYSFAAMAAASHGSWAKVLVVMLMLLGAGSKAGIVPLHVWLPLAHPEAPSHVSALMSGVMTKIAIYGFVRIVFDVLGGADWASAMVVLILGGITAVMGVLYALMQHDLKRLLAYHTVENIGIIFIGLGLALAFRANEQPLAAALALSAALFHVFNHSLFKSLLFFGSGAILVATGERDMDRMGGLIHRMPVSSVVFLVACVAISALPPFNGFVSEWLTFQAILQSPSLPQWGLRLAAPGVGGLLALAAALAAACFVKVYGVSFLGRARSEAAARAHEVDRFSLGAMILLALMCLLAGIFPGVMIDLLSPVTQMLVDARMPEQLDQPWLSIVPISQGHSSYNGALVFIFIALSASLGAYFIHRFGSRALRRAPAWDCGFPDDAPDTQYSAPGFAEPIRRVFASRVFGAREEVTIPPPGSCAPARFRAPLSDPVWGCLYAPIGRVMDLVTGSMNRLQFLSIRSYLSLVFASLILFLLVLAIWS